MMRLYIGVCSLFFLGLFSLAFAQSDEFNIYMQVQGGDLVPPSTPVLQSAIPVSSSQIDLSWSTSTDDVALGGYQVFRDAVQIATTTLTSYSDTGLLASTTYSYFVTAFDTSLNISSSSNTIATTTLKEATSTPQEEQSGGSPQMQLLAFSIDPYIHGATLAWKTNRYAQFQLRWGRGSSYELGFVGNEVFKKEHTTHITDLEPGTVYEYQLLAYDRDGKRFALRQGSFTTLPAPDTIAPSNVSNLSAVVEGEDVKLTWDAPHDADFSYVRIVRSYLFYPIDPYDGFIAYQGAQTSFFDTQALSEKNTQYYTVFSYDVSGNVSSGATVRISREEPHREVSLETFELSFEDIEVVQNDTVITNGMLNGNLQTTLRIAYSKLPEHLKTIIVTLTHPEDETLSFSFLLRVNNDKTYYEATLAPLQHVGVYPVVLTVFDYQTQLIKEVTGFYTVFIQKEQTPILFVWHTLILYTLLFWVFILIALLLLLYLLMKSIKTKKVAVSAVSLGGSFVLLLSMATATILYLQKDDQLSQSAALGGLDTPWGILLSLFAVLLLCAGICVFLLKRK